MEFISPSGEAQIGINPRFNEQDEDEFRLQDVFSSSCVISYHNRSVYIVEVSQIKQRCQEGF